MVKTMSDSFMSPLKEAICHGDTEVTEDMMFLEESFLCVGINVAFVSLW